jgi:hypothetical protein
MKLVEQHSCDGGHIFRKPSGPQKQSPGASRRSPTSVQIGAAPTTGRGPNAQEPGILSRWTPVYGLGPIESYVLFAVIVAIAVGDFGVPSRCQDFSV